MSKGNEDKKEKKVEWKPDQKITMDIKKGVDWKPDPKIMMTLKEGIEKKDKNEK